MRKIISSMWTTLDNFVAGPDDEMDWLRIESEVMAYEQSFVDDAEMLLLGRSTFGDFAGYWPKAAHNPASQPAERSYAQRVDEMKKIVVSASGEVAKWRNTEVLSTLDEKEIGALKRGGDCNIVISQRRRRVRRSVQIGGGADEIPARRQPIGPTSPSSL